MSVIAMAANPLRIAEDGQFMVHNSRVKGADGTATDLRSHTQALENLDDAMVSVYAARTGKPESQIREWMDAETWFTAKQAKEHGFVHEIIPAKGEKPQADARFGFRALPEIYAGWLQQLPSATTVAPDTDMDEQTLTRILAVALARSRSAWRSSKLPLRTRTSRSDRIGSRNRIRSREIRTLSRRIRSRSRNPNRLRSRSRHR
jgi:hypothetical protein